MYSVAGRFAIGVWAGAGLFFMTAVAFFMRQAASRMKARAVPRFAEPLVVAAYLISAAVAFWLIRSGDIGTLWGTAGLALAIWGVLGASALLGTGALVAGTLAIGVAFTALAWIGRAHHLVVAVQVLGLTLGLAWWQWSYAFQDRRTMLLDLRRWRQARRATVKLRRMEAASARRIDAISAVGHDLKQPVHALELLVHRLEADLAGAQQAQVLGAVKGRVTALSDMLGSLLELARLDDGAYAPRLVWTPLRALLQEALSSVGEIAARKGLALQLDCDAGLEVYTDPALLRRVAFNLVSNAVKYTFVGRVAVAGVVDGGRCTVAFLDTGVGIPPEKTRDVFIPYQRLSATRDTVDGLGLGLTLVKRAVDLLGYGLAVDSVVGSGSTFSLSMPAECVRIVPTAHPAEPDAAFAGASVASSSALVALVENDELARTAMVRWLIDWGHEVVALQGGSELLGRWPDSHSGARLPDLVLTDLRLGQAQDGLESLRVLRSRFPGARLPALLLTGDANGLVQARADEMGEVMVLPKPVRPQVLREAIRATLAREGTAAADGQPGALA